MHWRLKQLRLTRSARTPRVSRWSDRKRECWVRMLEVFLTQFHQKRPGRENLWTQRFYLSRWWTVGDTYLNTNNSAHLCVLTWRSLRKPSSTTARKQEKLSHNNMSISQEYWLNTLKTKRKLLKILTYCRVIMTSCRVSFWETKFFYIFGKFLIVFEILCPFYWD